MAALLGGGGCEDIPPQNPTPRLLAVDLLDNVDLRDGKPARHRLFTEGMPVDLQPVGPDLTIKIYLAAPLSEQGLQDAPTTGIVIRGPDAQPAAARGFRAEAAPQAEAPPGTVQELTLSPDLRSDRTYSIYLDPSRLQSADGQRFAPILPFRFRTAPRFIVTRTDPPAGASRPVIDLVRVFFSSPANMRVTSYGVRLRSGGKTLSALVALKSGGRELVLTPNCALPLGVTELSVPEDAVEEQDTLHPLRQPFQMTLQVTEDPGPCPN
jgi:hypothetical protein